MSSISRRRASAILISASAFRPAAAKTAPLREVLRGFQTTAMLVLRGGKPAFEYGDLTQATYIASARKSLVSMLYGPAVAQGKIRLDRTLAEMDFNDTGGLLPREREATIRDLLMARSGVYHPAANAGDASNLAPPRGSVQPGHYFLYNNWDFNALGSIYEQETGRDFYRAFAEDIATPIGLRDFRVEGQAIRNDTNLSRYPARHFVLSTRDMAAIGQLMLQRGKWEGRRVIPADWVTRTTVASTRAAEVARTSPFIDGLAYGWLWWVFDPSAKWPSTLEGAYTASGAYGQFITIVPKRNMVVAHKVTAPSNLNVAAGDYFGTILPAALQLA